jgi:P-aminobenzoate N-oxygenase AurF
MTLTEEALTEPTVADLASDLEKRLSVTRRVGRLNAASLRKVIEPDTEVPGTIGSGRVIPPELSTVADLDLDLSEEQQIRLSREELASVVIAGIRFESLLMSAFAEQIAYAGNITDPRMVYMLHEIGEETRHSRLFLRLVEQLAPQARNSVDRGIPHFVFRLISRRLVRRPAVMCVLVLAGEEIPDLLQKRMVEHPDTDPFLKEVNRYHRQEEARHLAFARVVLPELWAEASLIDRLKVKFLLPFFVRTMFDGMVHPGVYRTVGLPGLATWRAAARSPHQGSTRREAARAVLNALQGAGVLRTGRVTVGWRHLCGVDRAGQPRSV